MDCPVCKNAMIVLELDEVEVDYCADCRGAWLDAGELELLLEDAAKAKEVLKSFMPVKTNENHHKCPICRKKMEKVRVGGGQDQPELIDRCGRSHGLWFDAGELEKILKMGHFDDENKIPRLLGELFGTEKWGQ